MTTSRYFPTARLRLQRLVGSNGPLPKDSASEYVYNRGYGEGLQFEGDVSVATSTAGAETVLNLKLYNIPREQRGEVPLDNALVTLEVGYEDDGSFTTIFAGELKYATPSMEGATSVWTLYASTNSKYAQNNVIEWPNEQSIGPVQSVINVGTLIDEFAIRAGITVNLPSVFRTTTITSTTHVSTAMDLINLMIAFMSQEYGRAFTLVPVQNAFGSYDIVDVSAGIKVVEIDSESESVYQGGYQVAQNQAATQLTGNPSTTTEFVDNVTYALYYQVELPIRADIKMGQFVEISRDQATGGPVRFFVTSITYAIGSPWSMTVRGPVDGGKGVVI